MKDEEMAEEYSKKVCGYVRVELAQAFLAGLKAGRPQWHDLRKDPNDLPENKRKVWCDYDYGYGKGFYDKDDERWVIESYLYCSVINAWCELLTFDKE